MDPIIISLPTDYFRTVNQDLLIYSLTFVFHIKLIINLFQTIIKKVLNIYTILILVIGATAICCHISRISDFYNNTLCTIKPKLNITMAMISVSLSDILIVIAILNVLSEVIKHKLLLQGISISYIIINSALKICSLLMLFFSINGFKDEFDFCSATMNVHYLAIYSWVEFSINLFSLTLLSVILLVLKYNYKELFKDNNLILASILLYYTYGMILYIPMIVTSASLPNANNDVIFHLKWALQSNILFYISKHLFLSNTKSSFFFIVSMSSSLYNKSSS
ncbi:hypothetical protein K502DRAFT_350513 [Neoconidiobolus thromboides FSU 785]|nr:hypothetical protein K502DRAFT_350513 [Neoconidiobolus thromboides FSU 785]